METNITSIEIFEGCDITPKMLDQASQLIHIFFEQGLMVDQSPEGLYRIAENNLLCIGCDTENNVIACGGITAEYPDQSMEFGAWVVHPDYQKTRLGKQLLIHVLKKYKRDAFIFAVANNHSAKIFQHLGATLIPERDMHQDVFIPCQSCNCHGKEISQNKCVDTFHDLRTIRY